MAGARERAAPRQIGCPPAPCRGGAAGAGRVHVFARRFPAAAGRSHRDRLCPVLARHGRARHGDRFQLRGRALCLPSHRHLLAAGGNDQSARQVEPGRHRHLPAAVVTRRHPCRARHLVVDPAAAGGTPSRDRGGAVCRVAHRGAAGDAVDPRGPAAARDRRGAAGAAAPLLRQRARPRQGAVASARLLGGARRRHSSQCAGGPDPVAIDHPGALRDGPPRSTGCGGCGR